MQGHFYVPKELLLFHSSEGMFIVAHTVLISHALDSCTIYRMGASFFAVIGIELSALRMLDKHCTTELYPQKGLMLNMCDLTILC